MAHGIGGALVAAPAEELGDLVLQGLLQDQPRTEAAGQLNRIGLALDAGQQLIELAAKPLARDYLLHAGVPPSASTRQVKAEATPALPFPRTLGRHPSRHCRRHAIGALPPATRLAAPTRR